MIIFRSKPKPEKLAFRLTNSGKKPLHVLTEPWCDEFDLQPGDVLECRASVTELSDTDNPLSFEACMDDDHISLWCPGGTEFKVEKAKSE